MSKVLYVKFWRYNHFFLDLKNSELKIVIKMVV